MPGMPWLAVFRCNRRAEAPLHRRSGVFDAAVNDNDRRRCHACLTRCQTDPNVFDEPTIGLHPLDVRVLLHVFDELVANGATVVVIEHDLDVIANADYVVDMGPGGGEAGGRVVCEGAPSRIAACPESVTGRYLQSSQC